MEEKFTPANSNREEALKATNAVIKRLIKSGRLEEFQKQIKEMEDMGTIAPLTEAEIKNLELEPHHFNKSNVTLSKSSRSRCRRWKIWEQLYHLRKLKSRI